VTGLFSSFSLKDITLRNRIAVSPMCQYQAVDGFINDWHSTHYSMLARGGAGLVVVEATAVAPEGRITPGDVGLWSDEHTAGLSSIAAAMKTAGAVAGIQLAHAGRKAGCTPPWQGGAPLDRDDALAWEPVGPSAVPFVPGNDYIPREMTKDNIRQTQQDFARAAERACQAGFQWLELHFAHGFLAQSFLSPQSNTRSDEYGGSLEGRARFLLETVAEVRKFWPDNFPLTVRLGVVEFDDCPEHSFSESLKVIGWLKDAGVDFVDVGLSLATPGENIPWAANFMVPWAARVRREKNIPVGTSWMITQAKEANEFIQDGKVDVIFFARTLLANPHWPYRAARELEITDPHAVLPTPYAYWLQNWSE